jgi:hypothetical protein
MRATLPAFRVVVPADAGIQKSIAWTPACAGVTG